MIEYGPVYMVTRKAYVGSGHDTPFPVKAFGVWPNSVFEEAKRCVVAFCHQARVHTLEGLRWDTRYSQ